MTTSDPIRTCHPAGVFPSRELFDAAIFGHLAIAAMRLGLEDHAWRNAIAAGRAARRALDVAACVECGAVGPVWNDSGYVEHEDGSVTHHDPVCEACARKGGR